MVERPLKVYFEERCSLVLREQVVDQNMSSKKIVRQRTSPYKGGLTRVDELRQNPLKPGGKDLGNYLCQAIDDGPIPFIEGGP